MKNEVWNVPTLKSREIIENGLDLNSLKTPLVCTPTKQKKKSLWAKVKSVMTCTTTQQYTVTPPVKSIESEQELTRLNELRLLTLSYEAEMTELKDEISRLTKERTKLRAQKRKMKEAPPSPTHSIAQSSSSGFSEMSTPPSLPSLSLRPMSLASTMQRLEDAKILYIC